MTEIVQKSLPADAHRISRIVGDVLGITDVDPHANIIGLGANSMEIVRIINRVEDEMGKRLRFENVGFDASVATLVADLERLEEPGGAMGEDGRMPSAAATVPQIPADTPVVRENPGWARYPLNGSEPANTVQGSARAFAAEPVSLAALTELLDRVARTLPGSPPRAAYASAGGFFSVQVYMAVKSGGVTGLPCGLYYFQPCLRELWLIAPDFVVDRAHYDLLQNAPIYDQAAFSLHLVSAPARARRAYGARARDYCLLEAGAMAQRLREGAAPAGVGLCAIGDFAFEPLRAWFDVDDAQECLHTLIGGKAA